MQNFEKITCRVQSKNKDQVSYICAYFCFHALHTINKFQLILVMNQVRHYYYRLVRRMNKLLGPDLSLDAKNSKDTNAAMLRW